MAVGKRSLLNDAERGRVEAAVQQAEKQTGLQFLVYLGKTKGDPRTNATKLLLKQGYNTVPGVVLFVAPDRRRVEVVTSPQGRERLSDDAASKAVDVMVPEFSHGDWVRGIELGLEAMTEAAGDGIAEGETLPDILE